MPSRHFIGSVLSCVALLAVLMPATTVSAAPPVLRRSDGAPGEGGPIDDAKLEFAQKKAAPPKQNEPPQNEENSRDGDEPLSGDEEQLDLGVSVALDATDHLAPVDKALQTAWQRAVQAARQKNWPKVMQHLAPIIGRPDGSATEDAMIRLPDATLRSASLEAARLLLQLPKDARDERSRKLKSTGAAAIRRALENGNLRELQRVAVHFAGTTAGDAAADQLIALLVDRGHFGLASAWSAVLTNAEASATRTESWQRRDELISQVLTRSEHRRPGHHPTDDGKEDSPTRQLARALTPDSPETLSEWSLIGGNTRRHAVPQSETPTLVKRWSSVSTSDPQLAARIDQMIEDLNYDGRSSVPVGVPLFVNGRIALRTLRGIEVRDIQSGRLVWTAGDRRSLETLLGGAERDVGAVEYDHFDDGLFAINELTQEFEAADPTGGALGQALFQNATYGFLSSDGERLFAMSDDPVYSLGRTSVRNRNGRDVSPEPGSASANQLEAFDFKSGHLLWRLGGPETGEPASAPLTGWFFLGAPLASNDGLFVVAQNSETIRLFCLEAETGRVRWSQQIGWSDDRLDRDLNRRLWAALPSLANGVLVCPTSAGWVVGVDSLTGTLLWAHRFSTRAPESGSGTPGLFLRNRGMLEVANRRVDSHWVAAPPVIAGTSILLTPPETRDAKDPSTGIIVCLDLFSGRKLWELPRRDANQLAAVTDRVAVLAGNRSLEALTLAGRPAWKFSLPDGAGQISGRVLASEDTLFVPTQAGSVVAVSIKDGKLRQSWSPSENQRPPGSLYSYDGLLVSVHPAEVTAFELQSTLEQKLRESADNEAPQLAIQRAQLALARSNAPEARDALQGQRFASADNSERTAFDAAVLRTAGELRKASSKQAIDFLAATPQISDSMELSSRRAALEVQLLLLSSRRLDAFRKLMEIAVSADHEPRTLQHPGDPRIDVSTTSWLHETLSATWFTLSPGERQLADADVRRLLASHEDAEEHSAIAITNDSASRLARAFAFHPTAQSLLVRWARSATQDGRASDAVLWWHTLRQASSEPQLSIEAQLGLTLHTLPLLARRDRAWQLLAIARQLSQGGLSKDESIHQLMDSAMQLHRDLTRQAQSSRDLTRPTNPRPEDKPDTARAPPNLTVSLLRLPGSEFETRSHFLTNDAGESIVGPRFSAMLVSQDFDRDRLTVVDRFENGQAWSVQIGGINSPRVPLITKRVGTVLLTLQDRHLACLSVTDRRLLWSQTLTADIRMPQRREPTARRLLPGKEWIDQLSSQESVLLPSGSGRYLGCRMERELLVIETLTGRFCWRRKGLSASQRAVVSGETIVVVDSRGRPQTGYRMADGHPVESEPAFRTPSSIVRRDPWGTVAVSRDEDEIVVQRLEEKQSVWEHRFPATAKYREIGDTTLTVMKPRGHFETLDLRTGDLAAFPRIPARLRIRKDRVTILPDSDRWLLLLQGEQVTRPQLGSLPAINVQGTLVSFERDNPETEPWYFESTEFGMPLDEYSRLPFLILLRQSGSPLVPLAKTRHLTLLDRRTGKPAVDPSGKPIEDLKMPGDTRFSSISVPHSDAYVELRSGTERLRLTVRNQD